ncbi:MAG: group II intron reverse transcriptase/maturase [Clostridia bacterium]|nr:group II intron reverse transcriptase/maturase [Clostridia bacterium]
MLERILSRENMTIALAKVKKKRGSHGVDGMKTDELPEYLETSWAFIRQELLKGTYFPKPVRRVEIPKPDGGMRLLGIPTVLDRLIQQAISQVLSPVFETEFSDSSYGFRPGRSAIQAVESARGYIQQGYKWVVDIDLEKFFDRVNHDMLMSRVARKVEDKRVLRLIRKYLESGIMDNGILVLSEEGTPQGGNLSPLLSNIMLDDLDKELEKRGHKFCRYADDCNIYVKSEKAAGRVLNTTKFYIEKYLKLKVNVIKSAIGHPWERKFLGFSFYRCKGEIKVRIHRKSIERFKKRIKELTNRNRSMNIEERIKQLGRYTTGWVNYFAYADSKSIFEKFDGWIRRRLRACIWKQWKRVRTRYSNLKKLGVKSGKAWEWANMRKSYWRTAGSWILTTTMTNKYFEELGYKSLFSKYLTAHYC